MAFSELPSSVLAGNSRADIYVCLQLIGVDIQKDYGRKKGAERRSLSPAACSLAQRSGQLPQFVQQLDRGCG